MTELFIHSLRFSQNPDLVAEAPCCLSAEEQARAARFKVEAARQDFLVSHYLLRQTLCRYLRTDARSISYRYGEHGKPFLGAPASQNLNFNLSHSGDRLLIAVCRGGQIGVDIELVQERSDPLQLASHFMSGDEALQLACLTDPVAQRQLFFTLWTRKEAYIKALGKGFFQPLNRTDMQEIAPGIHLPRSADYRDYRVFDLDIAADYKAAVAVRMGRDSPSNAIRIEVFEQ